MQLFGRRREKSEPTNPNESNELTRLRGRLLAERAENKILREANDRLLNLKHEMEIELSQRPERGNGTLKERLETLLPTFKIEVRGRHWSSLTHGQPTSSRQWSVYAEQQEFPGDNALTLSAEGRTPEEAERELLKLAEEAGIITL